MVSTSFAKTRSWQPQFFSASVEFLFLHESRFQQNTNPKHSILVLSTYFVLFSMLLICMLVHWTQLYINLSLVLWWPWYSGSSTQSEFVPFLAMILAIGHHDLGTFFYTKFRLLSSFTSLYPVFCILWFENKFRVEPNIGFARMHCGWAGILTNFCCIPRVPTLTSFPEYIRWCWLKLKEKIPPPLRFQFYGLNIIKQEKYTQTLILIGIFESQLFYDLLAGDEIKIHQFWPHSCPKWVP